MNYDSVPLRDFKELNDWETVIFVYQSALKQVETKIDILNGEFQHRHKYNPIEHVKSRIKTPESIVKKLKRHGYESSIENMVRYVNDIAGIRIMVQFVDDIETVVQLLRGRSDMRILYEKDYITNVKPSGYRSYHMIIEYPVNMASGVVNVIGEIQIRTLAMNFWAVTEHSLNYKYKQSIPEHIKIKLKAAAESAYQLDETMLDIKDEIKDAQKLFEVKSALVSRIMNDILFLMSMGKIQEASRFQSQLNKLIEYGDVSDLNQLHQMVKKEINRFK